MDHEIPVVVPYTVAPADPPVTARKLSAHRVKQQASEPMDMPIGHEIAYMRPDGASVTQVVVAVDESVPELAVLGVRYQFQLQRLQIRE